MPKEIHQNIPDSSGMNAFRADPAMADLLRIYLSPEMATLALTQADLMGAMVGGRLEELALSADKNPPVLHIRARNGAPDERIVKHPDYEQLEQVAFGDFGLAAMSHRAGVFGEDSKLPPDEIRAGLSVRAGRVRAVLPALDDRLADPHIAAFRL